MNVTVFPSRARGKVTAPPSKSMAHRALICSALAGGGTVCHVAFSKDVEATIGCLQALGVAVKTDGDTVEVGRFSPENVPDDAVLYCNESGSTLRFFLPLCMTVGKPITFTGSGRLFERPLTVYEQIALEKGVGFCKKSDRVTVCGQLSAGEYTLRGDISSQFITGLLFALTTLSGKSRVTVSGPFESASYVDLTVSVLRDFGADITKNGNSYEFTGGKALRPRSYTVEGDCSNAAFLEAFNLFGGEVTVKGISPDTLQGDRVYRTLFPRLNGERVEADLADCPDLAPILMAVAAARGGARFTGTARLRLKESDRGAAMAAELLKFGITVRVEENTVTVEKGELCPPSEPLCGHNDHRIVMALTVLCTLVGGTVTGAEAVAKSYPDFFEVLRGLGIEVLLCENG